MEIGEFRERVHALLTEPETAHLPDEVWWGRFGELLDDVLAARARAKRERAQSSPAYRAWQNRQIPTAQQAPKPSPTRAPLRRPSRDAALEQHRFTFEGSTTLLARHLVDEHDALPGAVEPYAGGLSQGAWVALDDLHRAAHETPKYERS